MATATLTPARVASGDYRRLTDGSMVYVVSEYPKAGAFGLVWVVQSYRGRAVVKLSDFDAQS